MGSADIREKLKELQETLSGEQDETAQMIFDGLNSTDKILNLVREGIRSMTEVCYRQDGLSMGMEDVLSRLKQLKAEEALSKGNGDGLRKVEDKVERLAEVYSSGDESVLAAAAVFQNVLEEAEYANRVLHVLEEQMAAQLERSGRIYREMEEALKD